MTADEVIRLVTAIAGLFGVLVWPVLLLFLIIRFRAGLSNFFDNLGEFTFKAPGVEASARRQQVEAAAAIGAAIAKPTSETPDAVASLSRVAEALTEAVPDARAQRQLQGRLVLWVDDRPDNNRYERHALEALGIRFAISTSTDDAVKQVRYQPFDLIISDMGRPGDPRAGYTLLDKLKSEGDRTPFIIYAGSRAPEHVEEAIRRGAIGCTSSPQELIVIVIRALGSLASRDFEQRRRST
ncbi:MAG TPA: response regulator [Micromonosporaceae bacterium]|nr:response regulator [Micromonosporaceae bacterium]